MNDNICMGIYIDQVRKQKLEVSNWNFYQRKERVIGCARKSRTKLQRL